MFCAKCGKEISDESVFCLYCGTNMSAFQELNAGGQASQNEIEATSTEPAEADQLSDTGSVTETQQPETTPKAATKNKTNTPKKTKKAQKAKGKGPLVTIVLPIVIVLTVLSLAGTGFAVMDALNKKAVYDAADVFASTILKQDVKDIIKLTTEKKESDAELELSLLFDKGNGQDEQAEFFKAVSDTITYEVAADSIQYDNDSASAKVVFTRVDYEKALKDNDLKDMDSIVRCIKNCDDTKTFTLNLAFKKQGDKWLVSGINTKVINKIFEYYSFSTGVMPDMASLIYDEELSVGSYYVDYYVYFTSDIYDYEDQFTFDVYLDGSLISSNLKPYVYYDYLCCEYHAYDYGELESGEYKVVLKSNGVEISFSSASLSSSVAPAPVEYVDLDLSEYNVSTYSYGTGSEVINLWSFTDEVPNMMAKYIELHPEFGTTYTVIVTVIPTDGGGYQEALDKALAAGGSAAPDIYTAEASFVIKYSQGDMSSYAATYTDLGIEDVAGKIAAGEIAQYTVDVGSRDGEVVALGYQASGGAMIYRASIAEQVFGTSDPDEIAAIFGGGTQSWDQFWIAADTLNANNVAVVSGLGDIWNVVNYSTDCWVKDGTLNTASSKYNYFDMAKTLIDGGYTNDSAAWTDSWFADIKGEGYRPVFCYFGPAWLLNYTISDNCGDTYGDWRVCTPPVGYFWGGTWLLANKDTQVKEGVAEFIEWVTLDVTENGLQYKWANNIEDWDNDPSTPGAKDVVASTVVMNMSNGEVGVCSGQNIFPVFINGNAYATFNGFTQNDEKINQFFTDAVYQYAYGELDKDSAIGEFEANVYEYIVF